ncbi:MAG: hypothetical protein WDZ59_07265 [Pirellulales bacterium]
MTRREKTLAACIGAIVLLFAVYKVYDWVYGPQGMFAFRENQLRNLETQVADKETELLIAQDNVAQLRSWEQQSLPPNPDQARELYYSWLHDTLVDSELDFNIGGPSSGTARRNSAYQQLSFNVSASGSLQRLSRFLYDFYRGNHLHKIRSLDVKSQDNGSELKVTMSIDALILPGSTNTDQLNADTSDRLAHEDFSEYTETIVERNPFAPFRPAADARPIDVARHAYITAIIDNGQVRQAWLTVRTTGETHRLKVGEDFSVGELQGTVDEIRPGEVIISFEGEDQPQRIRRGSNLREAVAFADEAS